MTTMAMARAPMYSPAMHIPDAACDQDANAKSKRSRQTDCKTRASTLIDVPDMCDRQSYCAPAQLDMAISRHDEQRPKITNARLTKISKTTTSMECYGKSDSPVGRRSSAETTAQRAPVKEARWIPVLGRSKQARQRHPQFRAGAQEVQRYKRISRVMNQRYPCRRNRPHKNG